MAKIAASGAPFASRGDDSGTHSKELALWKAAGIDPAAASGGWYRETGSGMGATLNTAVGMGAYVLADRASWLSYGNRQGFAVMVEGDSDLFNQYGVMPVSKERCPNVKSDSAGTFIDWLVSEEGQAAIASFKINGEPLFFPNAR
jgi:tungstate transport system substrate-binding protein